MIRQLRIDRTRQKRITPDLILSQRNCHRLNEREYGRFGWCIVRLQTAAYQSADGGDTDDGAPVALLDHLTSCCLAGVESAFDVYIEAVG